MARLEDDLAASFRQGYHLARRDPNASPESILFGQASSTGGVCYILSAMWILRHVSHRGEGPAGRAAFLARESTIATALAKHQQAVLTCRTRLSGDPAPGHHSAITLRAQGLTTCPLPLGRIERVSRALEIEAATLYVSLAGSHRHNLLSVCGDNPATGHAMATYTLGNGGNSPAQIFLFDPNWGEFKVSVRHASGFMTRLLQWYDGHREFGRIKRLTVAGVRAGG